MWITSDVDLPQAVLDAQAEGRLVFFVGAGASVDAPSSLPLFGVLARNLADMARVPFEEDVALDFFLGSMPDSFDTHRRTREIIARGDSSPNATHAALVRVAGALGKLRVVTTNFDDHLSLAAFTEGVTVAEKWIGPALPLGDDFTGIVHLHGSVLRDPRELVLTDGDFGRAYLTNAWATRFLLPMFQNFTVLFIGYSHEDPIMRYLALGLPSGTPRYAFTTAAEVTDGKWSRLGVQTVGYPVRDHDHGALVAALNAWNSRARMGQMEHRARIVEIVSGGPGLTPVDHDYIVGQLKTVEGAQEYVRAVAGVQKPLQVAWLKWTEDLPEFSSMFNGQDGDVAANVLGNWFCQAFVAVPELHGAALQTVQRLGQSLSNDLFRAAGWSATDLSESDTDAGRRWKALLATSIPGHTAPAAAELLLTRRPADRSVDNSVLRAALRPYLGLRRRWTMDESEDLTTIPNAEVEWNAKERSLTEQITKAVDMDTDGDLALGALLEDSLSTAYDLLESYHGARSWDPLSFSRTAIEAHQQDRRRKPLDAIIDGLRVVGEKAVTVGADLPERWWSYRHNLFRRLALHLLTVDESRAADDKIEWLLERGVLFEPEVKHEVYRVLEVATHRASTQVLLQLLRAVQEGPSRGNVTDDLPGGQRQIRYAVYNMLVWLTRVAPEWSEAGAALEASQTENDDFAPREHPDLNMWMTSGTSRGQHTEPQDFIDSFEEHAAGAVDELLSRDYSQLNFDLPDWGDILSLLSRVAELRPDIGEKLLTIVEGRGGIDSQVSDIQLAVVEGWAKVSLNEMLETVLARVELQVGSPEAAPAVSQFLQEQIRMQVESDETPAIARMRAIALQLWTSHGHLFTHEKGVDLTSFAPLYLNSWPGELVQYWMYEVDRRWRKNREDWSGLNSDERRAFAQLLDAPRDALDATQPAIASHVFFLFAADPAFTTEHVLPLFGKDETAELVWGSFLHHPRVNDRMLAAGMLQSMIAEWSRLNSLEDSALRNEFFDLAASIVSFAGISGEERKSLLDQSVLACGGAYEGEFAQAVVRLLRDDGVDGDEVWSGWLVNHLERRLNGVPRVLGDVELTCWSDVVPYLREQIPDAAQMFANRDIGLGDQFFNPDIPTEVLSVHGPILVSYFADRVRHSPAGDHFIRHQVIDLIDEMRNVLDEDSVHPLLAAARDKGYLPRLTG